MFAGLSSIHSSSRRFGARSFRLLTLARFALLCSLLFTLTALASLQYYNNSKSYTITTDTYTITNNASAAIEIAGIECTIAGAMPVAASCMVYRVRDVQRNPGIGLDPITNLIASVSLVSKYYCQAGLSTFEGYYFKRGDEILIKFVPNIGTAKSYFIMNTLGSR